METYIKEIQLQADGKIELADLPFQKDDILEIIIMKKDKKDIKSQYPLRGEEVIYNDPCEPVGSEDWESVK